MQALQLLGEIEDLLRTMPGPEDFIQNPRSTVEWSGRAGAVMKLMGLEFSLPFDSAIANATAAPRLTQDSALLTLPRLLHQARFKLRMETVGPISAVVETGAVFEYFDEVRKIIEGATADLLFVDPFIDAEFVSRYLPHVKPSVHVRLLTRKHLDQLLPAALAFIAQHKTRISVRSSGEMHDRYVIVDGVAAYQSGASFKDGAKRSPTTLTQITDAFTLVRDQYERYWVGGDVKI